MANINFVTKTYAGQDWQSIYPYSYQYGDGTKLYLNSSYNNYEDVIVCAPTGKNIIDYSIFVQSYFMGYSANDMGTTGGQSIGVVTSNIGWGVDSSSVIDNGISIRPFIKLVNIGTVPFWANPAKARLTLCIIAQYQ